jgi:hypothetical protein
MPRPVTRWNQHDSIPIPDCRRSGEDCRHQTEEFSWNAGTALTTMLSATFSTATAGILHHLKMRGTNLIPDKRAAS